MSRATHDCHRDFFRRWVPVFIPMEERTRTSRSSPIPQALLNGRTLPGAADHTDAADVRSHSLHQHGEIVLVPPSDDDQIAVLAYLSRTEDYRRYCTLTENTKG